MIITEKPKKVMLIIGTLLTISIVFGLSCLVAYSSININRGGTERTQQVSEDFIIEQEIFINNTSEVTIGFLNIPTEESDIDGVVNVALKQGDVEEVVECKLENMPYRWSPQVFEFNDKNYKAGPATVVVTANNLKKCNVQVLLSGGDTQKFPIGNVRINGNSSEAPLYLVMNYEYWNLQLFFGTFLIGFIVSLILYGVWRSFIRAPKQNLVIITAATLIFFAMLENYKIYFELPLNGWCTTPFMLTFFDGVISKALPGTVLNLFLPYVTEFNLRLIFLGIFICLAISVLLFLNRIVKKLDSDENSIKLLYVYIVSPFFISWYTIDGPSWGRLDIIITFIFIVSCGLIIKKKWLYLLPILCAAAILTHQIFIFVFYPALFLLCMYQIIVGKEKKFVKPTFIHAIFSCSIAAIAQFSGSNKYSFEQLLDIVSKRTDAVILTAMIEGEHYLSFFENTTTYMQEAYKKNLSISLFLNIVLLLPLIIFLSRVILKRALMEKDRMGKINCIAFTLFPFASLPMFLTICDWGRIQMMSWNAIFFSSFTLMLIDNKVRMAFDAVNNMYVKKYGSNWLIALIVYMSLLKPFSLHLGILLSRIPIDGVERIFQMITNHAG